MTQTGMEPSPYSRTITTTSLEWFSTSGLPDTEDANAMAFARRLVRYISDPSTVRVRILDRFGFSPSIGEIRTLRQLHLASLDARKAKFLADEAAFELTQKAPTDEVKTVKLTPPIRTGLDVITACAQACGLTAEALVSADRDQRLVLARNLCAALLRARGGSYPRIGHRLGNRDHTTIMHGIERFFTRDMQNPDTAASWMTLAPCILKAARSPKELDIMVLR